MLKLTYLLLTLLVLVNGETIKIKPSKSTNKNYPNQCFDSEANAYYKPRAEFYQREGRCQKIFCHSDFSMEVQEKIQETCETSLAAICNKEAHNTTNEVLESCKPFLQCFIESNDEMQKIEVASTNEPENDVFENELEVAESQINQTILEIYPSSYGIRANLPNNSMNITLDRFIAKYVNKTGNKLKECETLKTDCEKSLSNLCTPPSLHNETINKCLALFECYLDLNKTDSDQLKSTSTSRYVTTAPQIEPRIENVECNCDESRTDQSKVNRRKSSNHEKSYEHIYILVSCLGIFIGFIIFLSYRKHKRTPSLMSNNIETNTDPTNLESVGTNTDIIKSTSPCLEEKTHDCRQNEEVIHEVNDCTEPENVTEKSDNDIEKEGFIILSEKTRSDCDASEEAEEQYRKKENRSVQFDESLNRTRQISCVLIAPDPETKPQH
uniref:CSON006119 protein n=1 Tax=Culicoides sonorensis TaxID=179676 RepID=A0A336M7U8_CULSO